jgi:hypothetical protein
MHTSDIRTPQEELDGTGGFAGGVLMNSRVSSTLETPFTAMIED